MIRLLNKLTSESKQVGKIYHFCTLTDVKKYICPTDTLESSKSFWNKLTKNVNTISFTRNPNLKLNTLRSFNIIVRFTVDGDKLSNNYKIMPYSAYGVSSPHFKGELQSEELDCDSDEMEEIAVKPIKNFHSYVLGIQLSVKEQNFTREDLLRDSGFQVLLDYIKEYNISSNNVEIILQGKTYKVNEILIPDISNIERIFSAIKSGKIGFIENLDHDSLFNLFYKIIHELEYDYPYDLVTNIDEFKKRLSTQSIKKCRDIFIEIVSLINKDELDEFVEFMKNLNFGS